MSPLTSLMFWCIWLAIFSTGLALQCFKCGQYNDGVGSITPCINDTYMKLEDCPRRDMNYCIKYMSEGTVVRDCVIKCTEKDNWDWNSRTFCCNEDACNAARRRHDAAPLLLLTALVLGCAVLRHLAAANELKCLG